MDDSNFDFNKELKRIFPVEIPEILQGLPKNAAAKVNAAIQKQNVRRTQDINYAQLILDVGELFAGDIMKVVKKKKASLTTDQFLYYQVVNRALFTALYYPKMNDREFDLNHKVQLAYFCRNLLQTFTKIYSIRIIHDQEAFIQETIRDEEKYQGDITVLKNILKAIELPDLPSEKKSAKAIYYKLHLEHSQIKILHDWIVDKAITPSPTKLINFLRGENQEIDINADRLHLVSYLLFKLNNAKPKILELSFGKGLFKHFESHISPFSLKGEKRRLDDFKREVINPKHLKTLILTEVDRLLDAFKKTK